MKLKVFLGIIISLLCLINVNIVTSEMETTIQSLIDAASPGDIIYLPSGTYYEHLYINKPLTLIGAPTTIDGNGTGAVVEIESTENVTVKNLIVQNALDGFYLILSHCCSIENNTVQNTTWAITMDDARNQTIKNNVIKNNRYGLFFYGVGNTFFGNIIRNNHLGIILYSKNNTFEQNIIIDNERGIYVSYESTGNVFFNNSIVNSTYINLQLFYAQDNLFYYNNFFKLGTQVVCETDDRNIWHNGTVGNYWSDYNGTDLYSGVYQNVTGSDGIGDTPYNMTQNNIDPYPLMTDPPFATNTPKQATVLIKGPYYTWSGIEYWIVRFGNSHPLRLVSLK